MLRCKHGYPYGFDCRVCAAAVSATSTERGWAKRELDATPELPAGLRPVGAAVSPTPRPPTALQLAAAADTIRRYAATADLNDTDRGNLRVVADDLGFAALASGRKT